MLKICNKIIEYSFYTLFLLVPLFFSSSTSELFEFNKIWLTFALTIIITGTWAAKSIIQKRILFLRTPLDIPILLFLLSQIISTIFSLDQHVSLWGYYSRFNGGLFSILSYIILYYAFVTNLNQLNVLKILKVSLISGLIVALWGLPAHFGYDPTCLIFRGTLDVSCWTDAFQPKVRIFSTLGQPNWLAAYLSILIPIAIGFGLRISNIKYQISNNLMRHWKFEIGNYLKLVIIFLLAILFYVDLLFTRSQSGFVGLWTGLIFFFGVLIWGAWKNKNLKFEIGNYLKLVIIFIGITFFVGQPISRFDKFTFAGIKNTFSQKSQLPSSTQQPKAVGELGGTDSGKIRMIVWKGAIDVFKANPIFGSGVETFAFAYYKYRPIEHNMVSEWDYLYNKAHNEYLNYLATTGAFGLGGYLLMIGSFLFITIKRISNIKYQISTNSKSESLEIGYLKLVIIGIISAYLSILVSNFFGFSVVIVNIYLFMIPAFVFVLLNLLDERKAVTVLLGASKTKNHNKSQTNNYQLLFVFIILIISLYLLLTLFRFRQADKSYSSGYNYDKSGDYQTAYPFLEKAVSQRDDEPMILDELSINNAILAVGLLSQKEVEAQTATMASVLAQRAVETSNQVVKNHPNNVVFWKTRTRVFYSLSQIDKQYLPLALSSVQRAHDLAPSDAKISYNLGLLYGQNNDGQKAIEQLKETIKLKPDYRDAYYALGLFYKDLSMDKEAVETMKYILEKISPKDEPTLQALKSWGE